ncbi:methyltransferase domain-containing protein [Paenibacillus sp. P22]|uniref:methyltransferase domain-containing protein n=2 Tax=Paenibacillus sp. P22 TaxID=483908 RepID=UPI0003FB97EC|nr:methyltransferase domain-containing protein [Paenibacillus sp. P22]
MVGKTSIVMLTFNQLEYTKQCIESIRSYTEPNTYELIIVDNGSTDGSREWLAEQEDIRLLLNEENVGFPKGCNQGISMSAGEQILLLNNDVVVTTNWLSNMLTCLYSDNSIGAVGCVTNNCSYYQSIPVEYETIEQMQLFAQRMNVSNPEMWDERLMLIGYCYLFKREILDEVGFLDEIFTPGNYEDNDYSYRIRLAGYRLMLCRDTFVHHYGSVSWKENSPAYIELMNRNRKAFQKKWGHDVDTSYGIDFEAVNEIRFSKKERLRVLDINCKAGGTLLQLKNIYKHAELHGIEADPSAEQNLSRFDRVLMEDPVTALAQYPDDYFDVVILHHDLHQQEAPEVLKQALRVLNTSGQIIGRFANALHYQTIRGLLDPNEGVKASTFKFAEAVKLFEEAGLKSIRLSKMAVPIPSNDDQFIQVLSALTGNHPTDFQVSRFLLSAWKEDLRRISIRQILQGSEDSSHYAMIAAEHDPASLVEFVEENSDECVMVLNMIGLSFIENGYEQAAVPLLSRAYELDPAHPTTLNNLGLVFYLLNQPELALDYLEMIPEPSEKIQGWIEALQSDLATRNTSMGDFDKESAAGMELILADIEALRSGRVSLNEFIKALKRNESGQDYLNAAVVQCYEANDLELTLSLLTEGIKLYPGDINLLMNSSLVLEQVGEYEVALSFLSDLQEKTDEINETIVRLESRINRQKPSILSQEQNDVQFTGERLVINKAVKEQFSDVLQEHVARYELACRYAEGKVVLDAACGAGYGSLMLQQAGASAVVGMDISEVSVQKAAHDYGRENIAFRAGDVNNLDVEDEQFDVVVSFETIEHIRHGSVWIKEAARVLKDQGLFIVSTPNRSVTNPGSYFDEKPLNHYHEYEYSSGEFFGELLKQFDLVELFGQTIIHDYDGNYSKVMRQARELDPNRKPVSYKAWRPGQIASYGEIKDGQAMYNIAVCRKK